MILQEVTPPAHHGQVPPHCALSAHWLSGCAVKLGLCYSILDTISRGQISQTTLGSKKPIKWTKYIFLKTILRARHPPLRLPRFGVSGPLPLRCPLHVQAIQFKPASWSVTTMSLSRLASQLPVYYLLIKDPGGAFPKPSSGPKNKP